MITKKNQNGWVSAKIRRFLKDRIESHVGADKEIPNTNHFINDAIKEKLERLEESKAL